MMRWAILMAALAVSGCTIPQVQTASQTSEKIDTEAADLYIAAATYLNADEAANPANVTKDEALKRKVWADYQAVDAAYKSGAILTVAILATLTADQTDAKGS